MVALAALALGCVALPAHAQPGPTSRPGGGMGGPNRPNFRGGGRPTFEEYAAARDFVQKNMPNLARAIDESEPGLPRRKLMSFAVERWRTLERVKRDEPDHYDEALARLQSHDEVFDLARQLNNASPEQRPAIREQMREKMRQIMLDLLAERERRIENLRRMLGREEDLLDRDRQNLDSMTDQRVRTLMEEMRAMSPGGDLTPPDLSTAPSTPDGAKGGPTLAAPSTAPADDRPRRER